MLRFFKKATPPADLLHFDEGVVVFRCFASLTIGERAQLHCRLPDEGQEFDAQMAIVGHDEVTQLYRGRVEKPPDADQFLSVLLPPSFVERRAQFRIAKALRVQSRNVAGFKCSTTDVCVDGLGLQTDDPKTPGDILALEIDVDIPDLRGLAVQVEVVWCLPQEATRNYRVGTRFLPLKPMQLRMLERLLTHLRKINE